jgi:bifunctional DNase/RNase
LIRDMKKGFTGLRIRGVSMENDEPIVILEDRATDRHFQIPIGPFEASAIILELECISPPRPLTHDLLAAFFEEGGFSLDEVELFGEPDSSSRALLSYHKGIRKYEKEVRPSDALALALRLDAPVVAEAAMFERRDGDAAAWRRPKILGLNEWKARA